MRTAFIVLVILHALIHLLGFLKGADIRDVKELSMPISRTMGCVWLLATILLLVYAVTFAINYGYAWLLGVVAIVVSQVLIVLFWKDARFGTIPNLILYLAAIVGWGQFSFRQMADLELKRLLATVDFSAKELLTEDKMKHLPAPVIYWLKASGAAGKPIIQEGRIVQAANMQMKPGDDKWLQADAIQYTTISNPAFLWTVDARMNSLLGFVGRDKFENGKGEMLIKLNALFSIVKAKGEKIDEGSLQRYLGEMVWFPALAISPYITWEAINDSTAKATMRYQGTTGSGIFQFNAQGEVTAFTALRYKGNEPDARRYEWIMQIRGYKVFEGIKVPAVMTSTWRLDEGDWTWLRLEVKEIRYNEGAGIEES